LAEISLVKAGSDRVKNECLQKLFKNILTPAVVVGIRKARDYSLSEMDSCMEGERAK